MAQPSATKTKNTRSSAKVAPPEEKTAQKPPQVGVSTKTTIAIDNNDTSIVVHHNETASSALGGVASGSKTIGQANPYANKVTPDKKRKKSRHDVDVSILSVRNEIILNGTKYSMDVITLTNKFGEASFSKPISDKVNMGELWDEPYNIKAAASIRDPKSHAIAKKGRNGYTERCFIRFNSSDQTKDSREFVLPRIKQVR